MRSINALILLSAMSASAQAWDSHVSCSVMFDGGWCAPVKTTSTGGCLRWGAYNSDFPTSGLHLAQDFCIAEGADVRAIADGEVLLARMDVGFYGGTTDDDKSVPGGALVVRHKTLHDGEKDVLYGHVKNLTVQAGDMVRFGDKIAEIGPYQNGSTHLHFGVADRRPDSCYEGDGVCSMWAGYGQTTQPTTGGYENPMTFLNNQVPDNWLINPQPSSAVGMRVYNNTIGWLPSEVTSCYYADAWYDIVEESDGTLRAYIITNRIATPDVLVDVLCESRGVPEACF